LVLRSYSHSHGGQSICIGIRHQASAAAVLRHLRSFSIVPA
jgi:hypothetical protein